MSSLAVKYQNSLNSISFRNFNAVEFDIFMTICAVMKEKGLNEITFNFDKLKELAKYQNKNNEKFNQDIKNLNKKLSNLNYFYEDEHQYIYFVLFTGYKIDFDNQTVDISINPKFYSILNGLTGGFTRFELQEFTNLKSTYSKSIYRLLKQYKSVGKREFSIDEFRHLLDVPASYKMGDIDKKVLQPSLKELKNYLHGLKIKKTYANTKGRPVKSLIFSFKAETNFDRQQEKYKNKESIGLEKDNLYKNPELLSNDKNNEAESLRQQFLDLENS